VLAPRGCCAYEQLGVRAAQGYAPNFFWGGEGCESRRKFARGAVDSSRCECALGVLAGRAQVPLRPVQSGRGGLACEEGNPHAPAC
jgi:hypothetical protein